MFHPVNPITRKSNAKPRNLSACNIHKIPIGHFVTLFRVGITMIHKDRCAVVDASPTVAHQDNVGMVVAVVIKEAKIRLFPNHSIIGSRVANHNPSCRIVCTIAGIGLIPALVQTGFCVPVNGAIADGHLPGLCFSNYRIIRMSPGLLKHTPCSGSIQYRIVIKKQDGFISGPSSRTQRRLGLGCDSPSRKQSVLRQQE